MAGDFADIYALVRQIPKGQVASYGMIASLLSGVTARIVGYAMAGTPEGEDIPWQRVIGSSGKISDRPGAERQRQKLEDEGIIFSPSGKVDWRVVRWHGPSEMWLDGKGLSLFDLLDRQQKWPQ